MAGVCPAGACLALEGGGSASVGAVRAKVREGQGGFVKVGGAARPPHSLLVAEHKIHA